MASAHLNGRERIKLIVRRESSSFNLQQNQIDGGPPGTVPLPERIPTLDTESNVLNRRKLPLNT